MNSYIRLFYLSLTLSLLCANIAAAQSVQITVLSSGHHACSGQTEIRVALTAGAFGVGASTLSYAFPQGVTFGSVQAVLPSAGWVSRGTPVNGVEQFHINALAPHQTCTLVVRGRIGCGDVANLGLRDRLEWRLNGTAIVQGPLFSDTYTVALPALSAIRANAQTASFTAYVGARVTDASVGLHISNQAAPRVSYLQVYATQLEPELRVDSVIVQSTKGIVRLTKIGRSANGRFLITPQDFEKVLGTGNGYLGQGQEILVLPVYRITSCGAAGQDPNLTYSFWRVGWLCDGSAASACQEVVNSVATNIVLDHNLPSVSLQAGYGVPGLAPTGTASPLTINALEAHMVPASLCVGQPAGADTGRAIFSIGTSAMAGNGIPAASGYMRNVRLFLTTFAEVELDNFQVGYRDSLGHYHFLTIAGTLVANPLLTGGGSALSTPYNKAYVVDLSHLDSTLLTGWPLANLDGQGGFNDLVASGVLYISFRNKITANPSFMGGTTGNGAWMRYLRLTPDYTNHCGTAPVRQNRDLGLFYNQPSTQLVNGPAIITVPATATQSGPTNFSFQWNGSAFMAGNFDYRSLDCFGGDKLLVRVKVPTASGYQLPAPNTQAHYMASTPQLNPNKANGFYAVSQVAAAGTTTFEIPMGSLKDYFVGTGGPSPTLAHNPSGTLALPLVLDCAKMTQAVATLEFELVWRCNNCAGNERLLASARITTTGKCMVNNVVGGISASAPTCLETDSLCLRRLTMGWPIVPTGANATPATADNIYYYMSSDSRVALGPPNARLASACVSTNHQGVNFRRAYELDTVQVRFLGGMPYADLLPADGQNDNAPSVQALNLIWAELNYIKPTSVGTNGLLSFLDGTFYVGKPGDYQPATATSPEVLPSRYVCHTVNASLSNNGIVEIMSFQPTCDEASFVQAIATDPVLQANGFVILFVGRVVLKRNPALANGYHSLQPYGQFYAVQNQNFIASKQARTTSFHLLKPTIGNPTILGTNDIATCGLRPVTLLITTTPVAPGTSLYDDFPNEFRNYNRLADTLEVELPAGFALSEPLEYVINGTAIATFAPNQPNQPTWVALGNNKYNIIAAQGGWPIVDVARNKQVAFQHGLRFNIKPTCATAPQTGSNLMVYVRNAKQSWKSHAQQLTQHSLPLQPLSNPSAVDLNRNFQYSPPNVRVSTVPLNHALNVVEVAVQISITGATPLTDGYLALSCDPTQAKVLGWSLTPNATTLNSAYPNANFSAANGNAGFLLPSNLATGTTPVYIRIERLDCKPRNLVLPFGIYRLCGKTPAASQLLPMTQNPDCFISGGQFELQASGAVLEHELLPPSLPTLDLCSAAPFLLKVQSNGDADVLNVNLAGTLPQGVSLVGNAVQVTYNGSTYSVPNIGTAPQVLCKLAGSLKGAANSKTPNGADRKLTATFSITTDCQFSALNPIATFQVKGTDASCNGDLSRPIDARTLSINGLPARPHIGLAAAAHNSDTLFCTQTPSQLLSFTLVDSASVGHITGQHVVASLQLPASTVVSWPTPADAPDSVLLNTPQAGITSYKWVINTAVPLASVPAIHALVSPTCPSPATGCAALPYRLELYRLDQASCQTQLCPAQTIVLSTLLDTLTVCESACALASGLSLDVLSSNTLTVNTCDTVEVLVDVRNTGATDLYNLDIAAHIPAGMSLVAGAAEYLFPVNSTNWTALGSTVSAWKLPNLSGNLDTAQSRLRLRFRVASGCDVVTAGKLTLLASAHNACQSLLQDSNQIALQTPAATPRPVWNITPNMKRDTADCGGSYCFILNVQPAAYQILPASQSVMLEWTLPAGASIIAVSPVSSIAPRYDSASATTTYFWELNAHSPTTFTACTQNFGVNSNMGCTPHISHARILLSETRTCGGGLCPVQTDTLDALTDTLVICCSGVPSACPYQFTVSDACAGDTIRPVVQYPAFFAQSGITPVWILLDKITEPLQPVAASNTPELIPPGPGRYYVLLLVNGQNGPVLCDGNPFMMDSLIVKPRPKGFIQLTGCSPFCAGDSVSLSIVPPPPFTGLFNGTVQWIDGYGNPVLDANNQPLFGNPIRVGAGMVAQTQGYFRAILTDNVTGCSSQCPAIRLDTAAAPAFDLGADITICDVQSAFPELLAPQGTGLRYEWYLNGSLLPHTGATLQTQATGTYTLRVGSFGGGCCYCWSSDSITVRTGSLAVSLNNTPVCVGETTLLTPIVSGGLPPYSFNWLPSGQVILDPQVGSIIASAGIAYQVIVTDANNCTQTAALTLTEVAAPSPDFYIETVNCLAVRFHAFDTTHDSSLDMWEVMDNSGNLLISLNGASPTFTTPAGGSYTVRHTVRSASCGDTSRTLPFFTTEPAPINGCVQMVGRNPYCEGDSVLLYANAAFVSVVWYLDGTTTPLFTGNPLVIGGTRPNAFGPGTYRAIATDANGCVHSCICAIVEKAPAPVVHLPDTLTLCQNTPSAQLCANIANRAALGQGTIRYTWYNAAHQVVGTDSCLTVTADGTYTLSVEAPNTCAAQFQTTVVRTNCATGPASFQAPSVGPNPANSHFTLYYELLEDGVMELNNSLGQLIITSALAADAKAKSFDVSNLSPGIYYVNITAKNYKLSKSIKLLIVK